MKLTHQMKRCAQIWNIDPKDFQDFPKAQRARDYVYVIFGPCEKCSEEGCTKLIVCCTVNYDRLINYLIQTRT